MEREAHHVRVGISSVTLLRRIMNVLGREPSASSGDLDLVYLAHVNVFLVVALEYFVPMSAVFHVCVDHN